MIASDHAEPKECQVPCGPVRQSVHDEDDARTVLVTVDGDSYPALRKADPCRLRRRSPDDDLAGVLSTDSLSLWVLGAPFYRLHRFSRSLEAKFQRVELAERNAIGSTIWCECDFLRGVSDPISYAEIWIACRVTAI